MAAGGREYPDRPWVGVGGLVFRGDDLLLVRSGRGPRRGLWGLPGGAQHVGETVFEAAVREVREETGLDIAPVEIVTVVDSIRRDKAGRPQYHYTLVEVLAEWLAGEPVPGDDADRAEWVAPGRIAEFDLWSETLRVIEMARARRRRI